MFAPNRDVHTHNTRQRNDPHANAFSLSVTGKSLIHQGPVLWGKLPNDIKIGHCKNKFSKLVKKRLLNELLID